jgi:ribosomal protein S18 acetylase RimI-like enzyme
MQARPAAQPSATLLAAVENNAEWCAAFCRACGVIGSRRGAVWSADGPAPELYPELVTLRPGVSAAEVASLAPLPGSAVKDSFQDVDLAAEGFRQLFQASWLSLRREDLGPDPDGQCSRAGSADELAAWVAESGSDLEVPERLLDRPEFRAVLVRRGGRVVAGATVFTTDGFAGVSNLFAHEDPAIAWSTLAHHLLADRSPAPSAATSTAAPCLLRWRPAPGSSARSPSGSEGPGRSRGWDRTPADRPTLTMPALTPEGSGAGAAPGSRGPRVIPAERLCPLYGQPCSGPVVRTAGRSRCGTGRVGRQTAVVIVRARRPADLPACVKALAEVHVEDGYPKHWPEDPVTWLDPPELLAAWVSDRDEAISGHVILAGAVDDPLLARAMGRRLEQLASVSCLFVRPPARGAGLAQALLTEAGAFAAAHDLGLVLDVIDDALSAISLYERLGWQLVGRRPASWTTDDGHRPLLRVYVRN